MNLSILYGRLLIRFFKFIFVRRPLGFVLNILFSNFSKFFLNMFLFYFLITKTLLEIEF